MKKRIPAVGTERHVVIAKINSALAQVRNPEGQHLHPVKVEWDHLQSFCTLGQAVPCSIVLGRHKFTVVCDLEDILKHALAVPLINPNKLHRDEIADDMQEFADREGLSLREYGESWTAEELYEFAEARITKLLNYLYAREFNRLVGWSKPKSEVAITAHA